MAWIPIYKDENDAILIKEKLNADSEIAFISSKGIMGCTSSQDAIIMIFRKR